MNRDYELFIVCVIWDYASSIYQKCVNWDQIQKRMHWIVWSTIESIE